ncbi:MAG: hypothetical protein KatS3mg059_0787 [Thermomicrobiales bacterium]|nr:MAG: hypothetical protein KatS3mg059_0787 [Thermomicrobiales bacterium]
MPRHLLDHQAARALADETGRGWVPPPWHGPPVDESEQRPSPTPRRAQQVTARRPSFLADPARRVVLGLAAVPAITGALALIFAFVPALSGSGSVPVGLLLVAGIQTAGYLLTRGEETTALSRAWLVGVIIVVGVLPLLSLQQALLREPYVALSRGTAAPAVAATSVVVIVLLVVAAWCAVSFWPAPEEASLVFMPVALLIPGVIGMRGALPQRSALEAVAEATLLAAGATAIAWALPRGARPMVAPVALAIQFVALWLAGRGPTFQPTSGQIVPALYTVLLVVTVALTVGTPLLAVWIRRLVVRAEPPRRPRQPDPGDEIGELAPPERAASRWRKP